MKYKEWKMPSGSPRARQALEAAGIPPLLAAILSARGITQPDQARQLLTPRAEPVLDPMLLRDMDRAAARVRQALETGEHLAVYGDYDVDGITSTCLLTDCLRSMGGQVTCPTSPPAGGGLRRQPGGGGRAGRSGGYPDRYRGLRHHRRGGVPPCPEPGDGRHRHRPPRLQGGPLPAAAAVVDPHRPDCPYPFKGLAGVGVALKLAMAVAGPEKGRQVFEATATWPP